MTPARKPYAILTPLSRVVAALRMTSRWIDELAFDDAEAHETAIFKTCARAILDASVQLGNVDEYRKQQEAARAEREHFG